MRRVFADATVLAIAHRMNTIMYEGVRCRGLLGPSASCGTHAVTHVCVALCGSRDSDKIVVMDDGRVVEYDSPVNLLRDADSMFSGAAPGSRLAACVCVASIAQA